MRTPKERQAASRARKKATGFTRVTLALDAETTGGLRRLAKREKMTQAQIIAVAMRLLTSKEVVDVLHAWARSKQDAGTVK